MSARNFICAVLLIGSTSVAVEAQQPAAKAPQPAVKPPCAVVAVRPGEAPDTICFTILDAPDVVPMMVKPTMRSVNESVDTPTALPVIDGIAGRESRTVQDLYDQAEVFQRPTDPAIRALLEAYQRHKQTVARQGEERRLAIQRAAQAAAERERVFNAQPDTGSRAQTDYPGLRDTASVTPEAPSALHEPVAPVEDVQVPPRSGPFPLAKDGLAIEQVATRLADLSGLLFSVALDAKGREIEPERQRALWETLNEVIRDLDRIRRDAGGKEN